MNWMDPLSQTGLQSLMNVSIGRSDVVIYILDFILRILIVIIES
jgi:hypothetical protein